MDLDNEELMATRRLNGATKDNIEEDIYKRCKELTKKENARWIGISNQRAIKKLLKRMKELETKQKAMCEEYCPKTERIKELEVLEDDLKDKRIVYIDTPEFEKEFIPKQKVKDVVKEAIEIIESEQFKVIMGDMTKINRLKWLLKKELLEDK